MKRKGILFLAVAALVVAGFSTVPAGRARDVSVGMKLENFTLPVLIDKNNVIADKLNAFATPQVYYFDADDKLVYFGAIDNDRAGANVTSSFLRDALEENLTGKPVAKAHTKAFGCSIKRINQ